MSERDSSKRTPKLRAEVEKGILADPKDTERAFSLQRCTVGAGPMRRILVFASLILRKLLESQFEIALYAEEREWIEQARSEGVEDR